GDGDLEVHRAVGGEVDAEPGLGAREGVGGGGEGEAGAADDAVEAAVAEDEPVGLDLGRERLPPARADRPPHLEDVGEVGREVEGEREVEGGAVEAADAEALVEDAVVDEDGPG